MRSIVLFLAFFGAHTLSAQNVQINPAVEDQEQLTWQGRYEYRTNPYDTLYGFYTFYPKAISYSKNGIIKWTISLPERMQAYEAQSIYDKTTDSIGISRKLQKEEIDVNKFYHKEFLKCPVFISEKIIALADRSGFLLIDKLNGEILTDIKYQSEEDFFWFDEGSYLIKSGKKTCKGKLPHGSSFIETCAGNLFHFNEQELFVWDNTNNLLRRIRYKRASHFQKTKSPIHYKALIVSKGFRIELEGMVFVK